MKTKFYFLLATTWLTAFSANAEEIAMNTAKMQAMDKITGRVSIIEAPVNANISFGTFSVVVRSCKTRPEGEVPENFAFVDVSDKTLNQEEYNIFKGWMLSSNPATNAIEHPIYDVWLLKCINTEVNPEQLMSEEELKMRDSLPRLQEIKEQQKSLQENSFEEDVTNIEFKDSMYKEEQETKDKSLNEETEPSGGPQNLLNISESYEEPIEENVVIPAEELSQSLQEEQQALPEYSQETPDSIDQELAAAIEKELAGHEN